MSPDGGRLAYDASTRATDVWVYDLARDALTRVPLTPHGPEARVDAGRPAYRLQIHPGHGLNLYWQRADGVGDVQRLTESPNPQTPASWHPSGKFLAFHEVRPGNDLMILPMEGDEASGWKPGKPTVFLSTPGSSSSRVLP